MITNIHAPNNKASIAKTDAGKTDIPTVIVRFHYGLLKNYRTGRRSVHIKLNITKTTWSN